MIMKIETQNQKTGRLKKTLSTYPTYPQSPVIMIEVKPTLLTISALMDPRGPYGSSFTNLNSLIPPKHVPAKNLFLTSLPIFDCYPISMCLLHSGLTLVFHSFINMR